MGTKKEEELNKDTLKESNLDILDKFIEANKKRKDGIKWFGVYEFDFIAHIICKYINEKKNCKIVNCDVCVYSPGNEVELFKAFKDSFMLFKIEESQK